VFRNDWLAAVVEMGKAQFLSEVVTGNGIQYPDILSHRIEDSLEVWLFKKWNYLDALTALWCHWWP